MAGSGSMFANALQSACPVAGKRLRLNCPTSSAGYQRRRARLAPDALGSRKLFAGRRMPTIPPLGDERRHQFSSKSEGARCARSHSALGTSSLSGRSLAPRSGSPDPARAPGVRLVKCGRRSVAVKSPLPIVFSPGTPWWPCPDDRPRRPWSEPSRRRVDSAVCVRSDHP